MLRALAWLLLPLGVWGSLKLAPSGATAWRVSPPERCSAQTPALWMNGQSQQLGSGETAMATSSTVYQRVCQPGTLTFQARGTAVRGRFPLMSVTVADRTLLTTRVAQPRRYRVGVPEAGVLAVTFHDDAYAPKARPPEDRNLFVSQLRFRPEP